MNHREDAILIAKCLKGDKKAQRQLFGHYRHYWFMCCLRYASNKVEAEDMLQDGLVSVFTNLRQFDSMKSAFGTWSYKIMVNASLQYLRKWRKIDNNTFTEDQYQHLSVEPGIYGELGVKELLTMVQKLPYGYRVVFNLYVIEGYKHHEIAEKLKISVNTSKSQLFKAKRMLRIELERVLQNQG